MRHAFLSVSVVLALVTAVSAQVAKVAPASPKTKFEQFQSKDGVLRITEFYDLPPLSAKFGTAEVKLINSKYVNSTASAVALRFSYNSGKEYASDSVTFLDGDEINSLADALDYIIRNQATITAQATTYTEITYASRGGFRAGFFYQPSDKSTGFYAEVNGENVFLEDLSGLRNVVAAAQKQAATLQH